MGTVQITLSSGSVNVGYRIVLPTITSASARTALTSAISSNLTADLVEALSAIPGIDGVTSGSMSISRLVCDDVEYEFTGEASLGTSSVHAAFVLALAAFAASHRN